MPPAGKVQDCSAHEARIHELESQAKGLWQTTGDLREVLSGLRTDLALTRQSLDSVREELKESRTARALPTRAAWLLLAGALVTGALGGWIGRQLPDIPKAQVAQASTIGVRP